jgi:hypothetical protein
MIGEPFSHYEWKTLRQRVPFQNTQTATDTPFRSSLIRIALYSEEGDKYREEFLKSLPERREKLCPHIPALETLDVNFEAGLYDEGLEELKQYLIETGIAEEIWDRDFCRGFGG